MIPYKVNIKADGSYGYAEAQPNNTISADRLTEKVIEKIGIQVSKPIVKAVIAGAFQCLRDEVSEGNRVYLPDDGDGNSVAGYPIIEGSTIKSTDKDADGNAFGTITEDIITARAAQWKLRLGIQVATNFADITQKSSLSYNGAKTTIKVNGTSDTDTTTPDMNPEL